MPEAFYVSPGQHPVPRRADATKRGGSLGHRLAVALFIAYLLVASTYVWLSLRFDAAYMEEMRRANVWANINPVPFRFGSDYADPIGRQALGNLLLGVPLGFGLPFVARVRTRSMVTVAVLFGVVIEVVQLFLNVLGIAFPARTVDVNDAILNAAGAMLGFGVFAACRRVCTRAWGDSRLPGEPWRHFCAVLTGRWRRTGPA